MADRPVVQIVGDGVTGRWVTWRWGGTTPSHRVAEVPDSGPTTRRLHHALGLDGELTRPSTELELMTELGRALLPAELRISTLGFFQILRFGYLKTISETEIRSTLRKRLVTRPGMALD